MASTIASDQPIGSNRDQSLQQVLDERHQRRRIRSGQPDETGISVSNFNSLQKLNFER